MSTRPVSAICTTCWQLRRTGPCVDHCRCTRTRRTTPIPPDGCTLRAEEVRQIESLLPCHLCYVCGLDIARGHTRWLHLLCPACKDRARALNDRAGRLVLPLGIHSIVNGVAFRPNPHAEEVMTLAQAVAFADQLQASTWATAAAGRYGERLLQERCERLGLAGTDLVDLATYLEAAAAAGETRELAWERLESFLSAAATDLGRILPDEPDRC